MTKHNDAQRVHTQREREAFKEQTLAHWHTIKHKLGHTIGCPFVGSSSSTEWSHSPLPLMLFVTMDSDGMTMVHGEQFIFAQTFRDSLSPERVQQQQETMMLLTTARKVASEHTQTHTHTKHGQTDN